MDYHLLLFFYEFLNHHHLPFKAHEVLQLIFHGQLWDYHSFFHFLKQPYLLSCSVFNVWSTDLKNNVYIVMLIIIAWLIPLIIIFVCYIKVKLYNNFFLQLFLKRDGTFLPAHIVICEKRLIFHFSLYNQYCQDMKSSQKSFRVD